LAFDMDTAAIACGGSDPWSASYWNNNSWTGDPDVQRCESEINENWGSGNGPGGQADNFSGRWTRAFDVPTTADYSFTLDFDDGYWIYIDGVLQASESNAYTGVRTEVIELAAGTRQITVEMREGGGGARAIMDFAPVVAGHVCTDVSQWQASYWNNTDLSGSAGLEECASAVDINWGSGGPNGQNDGYSARYVKTIDVPATADYQFTVGADDGIRVEVDGVSIYENWTDGGFSTVGVVHTLSAGQHEVVVEYYENGGGAQVFFDYALAPGSSPVLLQTAGDASTSGNVVSDGTGIGWTSVGQFDGSPDPSNGAIEFTFTVTEAGDYDLRGSVKSVSSGNTFWVSVNGGSAFQWVSNVTNNYATSTTDNGSLDSLSAGTHTVTLYMREDGKFIEWAELVRQ
ncbi:MAG: PA14 domain-containing protein, partial [Ilumatobacter sp.]